MHMHDITIDIFFITQKYSKVTAGSAVLLRNNNNNNFCCNVDI